MFLSIAYSDSQFLSCPLISHTATGRCRLAWLRNTLFPVAAGFAMPEIHYFRPPQTLQCSKYTISDCRRLCNARNTLFLVAADLHGPEIHYFWPPQTCMAPKYIISGRRRFYNARNTLFPPPRVPQEWKSGHPTRCRSGRFSKKMVGDSLERLQLADGGLGVGRAEDVAAGHEHVGTGIEEHAGRLGVHAAVYLDERL